MRKARILWYSAFTAFFAVVAGFLFWGAWSPSSMQLAPDDGLWYSLSLGDQFRQWLNGWFDNGIFVPVDIFWNGVFASKYTLKEFKFVSGMYLSAVGLAYFLRGRGLSRAASYGAGLFLAFCGYWCTLFSAGHGGWFIVMSSMVAAFGFMDRAITGNCLRHWLLLGACAGWGCSRQPDLFLLFALLVFAYGVYACIRSREFPWKGGLVALVLFVTVGGPGIRSAFVDSLTVRDRQIAESSGTSLAGGRGKDADAATEREKAKKAAEERWIFATNWSMPPEDTFEFFIPRVHGDTSCQMTLQLGRAAGREVRPYTGRLGRPLNASAGNYRQHSLYVGWITCLLAVFSLIVAIRRRHAHATVDSDLWFFAAAAFVGWLLSMGRFCEPIYRLFYMLPFGDYLRAPVKWHHVTEFCLCVLAGYGLEALYQLLRAKFGERAQWKALAVVAAVTVIGVFDLARIDRLFCAPIDMRIVCNANSAANEVIRRGKGRICDLFGGGDGPVSWSFNARGIGTTRELNAADVRFVFAPVDLVRRNAQLSTWLKQKAVPAGNYLVLQDGIRATAPEVANAALYQVSGVPPPPPPRPFSPKVHPLVLALALLSLAGTAVALSALIREMRLLSAVAD